MGRIIATLVASTFVGIGAASAADIAPLKDAAKAQYDTERARCLAGGTGQDQAACLKSAGAAYDAIRQNRLQDANSDYRDNAVARCQALPARDRADCIARIDGGGTTSGSVQGGGTVTEIVTPVPATPATK